MRRGSHRRLLYARDGVTGKRIVAKWVEKLLHTGEAGDLVLLRCGIFAPHPGVPSLACFPAADSP